MTDEDPIEKAGLILRLTFLQNTAAMRDARDAEGSGRIRVPFQLDESSESFDESYAAREQILSTWIAKWAPAVARTGPLGERQLAFARTAAWTDLVMGQPAAVALAESARLLCLADDLSSRGGELSALDKRLTQAGLTWQKEWVFAAFSRKAYKRYISERRALRPA